MYRSQIDSIVSVQNAAARLLTGTQTHYDSIFTGCQYISTLI